MHRRKTRTVSIGTVKIGHRHPVSIQSMAKTRTQDVPATVRQICRLEKAGCEIVRVAVKNMDQAMALDRIKAKSAIPLVADIHFNYRLALEAIARGVHAIRLNPGNIHRREEVREIAAAARKKRIAIRVGVNSGSLRDIKCKMKNAEFADLMVKNALDYIRILEGAKFYDIIISLKASNLWTGVSAYRKIARLCAYPLHLGVTACGLPETGIVKSAVGIGSLLLEGLGDTIRVSLTAEPEEEVQAAKQILQSLGLRRFGPQIIACPTCGRCQSDVIKIAQEFQRRLRITNYELPITPPEVAIMGCEVNGPGEARDADIGVACGKGSAVLFKKGKIIKRVKEQEIVNTLIDAISA